MGRSRIIAGLAMLSLLPLLVLELDSVQTLRNGPSRETSPVTSSVADGPQMESLLAPAGREPVPSASPTPSDKRPTIRGILIGLDGRPLMELAELREAGDSCVESSFSVLAIPADLGLSSEEAVLSPEARLADIDSTGAFEIQDTGVGRDYCLHATGPGWMSVSEPAMTASGGSAEVELPMTRCFAVHVRFTEADGGPVRTPNGLHVTRWAKTKVTAGLRAAFPRSVESVMLGLPTDLADEPSSMLILLREVAVGPHKASAVVEFPGCAWLQMPLDLERSGASAMTSHVFAVTRVDDGFGSLDVAVSGPWDDGGLAFDEFGLLHLDSAEGVDLSFPLSAPRSTIRDIPRGVYTASLQLHPVRMSTPLVWPDPVEIGSASASVAFDLGQTGSVQFELPEDHPLRNAPILVVTFVEHLDGSPISPGPLTTYLGGHAAHEYAYPPSYRLDGLREGSYSISLPTETPQRVIAFDVVAGAISKVDLTSH